MSESPVTKGSKPETPSDGAGERLVYVLSEGALESFPQDEIDFRNLWGIIRARKWVVVALTSLIASGALAYALIATEWYRAEILLAPTESKSTPSLGGQLGGLAALAGVTMSGGQTAEAIATLESRELAREFIETNALVPVLLYRDWDAAQGTWKVSNQDDIPDVRDAVELFHRRVLSVREAKDTGLVTVAIEWIDPSIAADWASQFVRLANSRLRQRALAEAETNVDYLRAELAQTSVVALQQSIGRLLEAELQRLMLARGSEEFAFRVIDAASPPKEAARPKRVLIVAAGLLSGGVLAILGVLLLYFTRRET